MYQDKRKKYFIDKGFQSKFIVKFCIIIVLASILIGALTYVLNQQTTTVAFENLRVVVKTTGDFIMPAVFFILIIVTIVAGAVTIVVTLFASHKISGPLFKLNKELQKIKEKDLSSPIYIRSTDQLQDIASGFEEMRKEYNNSIKQIKENVEYMIKNFDKIKNNQAEEEVKEKITHCVEKIDSELKKFKTE